MSRKDYKQFADAIKAIKSLPHCTSEEQVRDVKIVFADICSRIFADDNYNYDAVRFYDASGVNDE